MLALRHVLKRLRVVDCVKRSRFYCQQTNDCHQIEKTEFDRIYDLFKSKNYQLPDRSETDGQSMTFAALLRNSSFIDLGDPEGKVVKGKVFHIVEDDLYIDFNWKFYCVCPRPKKRSEDYVRGSEVKLLVKSLEIASKFLGYEKDLTLLEADCVLLGLLDNK